MSFVPYNPAAAAVARSYLTDNDWLPHKDEILSLRKQKMTLEKIADLMREKYNFHASTSQYKLRLKAWNSKIYTTREDRKALLQRSKAKLQAQDALEEAVRALITPAPSLSPYRQIALWPGLIQSFSLKGSSVFKMCLDQDMTVEEIEGFATEVLQYLGISLEFRYDGTVGDKTPLALTSSAGINQVQTESVEEQSVGFYVECLRSEDGGTRGDPLSLNAEFGSRIEDHYGIGSRDVYCDDVWPSPENDPFSPVRRDYFDLYSSVIQHTDIMVLQNLYPFILSEVNEEQRQSRVLKFSQISVFRALSLADRRSYADALGLLYNGKVLLDVGLSQSHVWSLRVNMLIATLYMELDENSTAEAILRATGQTFGEKFGAKNIETRECYLRLGHSLVGQERLVEACVEYEKAFIVSRDELLSNLGRFRADKVTMEAIDGAVRCYSAALGLGDGINSTEAEKYVKLGEMLPGCQVVCHGILHDEARTVMIKDEPMRVAFARSTLSANNLTPTTKLCSYVDLSRLNTTMLAGKSCETDRVMSAIISSGRYKGYETYFIRLAQRIAKWYALGWSRKPEDMKPRYFSRSLKYYRWALEQSTDMLGARDERSISLTDDLRRLLSLRGLVRYSRPLSHYVVKAYSKTLGPMHDLVVKAIVEAAGEDVVSNLAI